MTNVPHDKQKIQGKEKQALDQSFYHSVGGLREYYIDTGFKCSVCYKIAQVLCAGESMCKHHAILWNHGYGKTIKELKEQNLKNKQSWPVMDLDK